MSQDPEAVTISFDRNTTELDALQRAAYAITDLMTVDIRESAQEYVCTLYPRRDGIGADELRHRIRAEVIDQALRLRIARETEPVRNLVFALAFSQTGLADGGDADE